MKITYFLALLIAFTGLYILWSIFFKKPKIMDDNSNNKKDRNKEYRLIQSLIRNMEEENPQLVKDLIVHLNAVSRLNIIKKSNPDDINLVLKYWLYNDW
ncbi:hypothetical protein L9W92_13210 [Pelotomaculum terephthalicicum JT]|uniref:hypothetical protein n=1 Tax=Pelotomaculum TaxID=191373 RepID=UPI0009D1AB40|nr:MULTISPECIES: hypothetical protein [Pelotomaculum]MCG9968993.1 hypothetical protein [Pelotomaculum terephthalicicum JT]OPX87665.1 MAG: hypothetical protein A4E54_01561 [Pelotomaculum sp. PtaB.Bin117]OPY61237.1 MAG: hypothetical protein A4E56_02181 [Pelotomaculum sp. PtaU1.Bin065]